MSSIPNDPFATRLNTFELRNRVRTTKYHLLREGRYYPLAASLLDRSVLTVLYLFLFRRTNVRRPNVHLIATVRMDLEKKAFDVNATSDSPERLATGVSEIIYCIYFIVSFILFIFYFTFPKRRGSGLLLISAPVFLFVCLFFSLFFQKIDDQISFFCLYLVAWVKLNVDPVCFGTRDDSYGVFNVTKGDALVHRSLFTYMVF